MIQTKPRDWREDEDRLSAFLYTHLPFPPVFATLSGADLYGFPSDDGDYDLRASHVLPMDDLMVAMLGEGGMDKTPNMTVEYAQAAPLPEMDFVSHDIGKFMRLLLKANGYVLEQLLSPLVVVTSPWHEELKALAPRLITRRLYFHYRGFFANQEKIYNNIGSKRVKGLLYQYRVALTGIHALETGEIEANILKLNERFRNARIDELVALKVGGEAAFLTADTAYLEEIRQLEPMLDAAYETSRLPETIPPETRHAVEDLHIRCRRALGNS
jgi:predicted nucleotidyltransferase